jgi:hypothetical protein
MKKRSGRKTEARTGNLPFHKLRIVNNTTGDLLLVGNGSTQVPITNWSFGQLCRAGSAPADYLANKLSAPLAAQCLNENIGAVPSDKRAVILFQSNGTLTARAIRSDIYARIFNADLTARLLVLQQQGWNLAPAAYDGSRGAYMDARDMFVFMVDNDRRIFERDPNGGLSRGFFLTSSEVGA